MSNDITEHSLTLTVPDSMMEKSLKAFLALRKLHKARGGTSKLRRNGNELWFSARGSTKAVMEAVRYATKIQDNAATSQDSVIDSLKDIIRRGRAHGEERKEDFLGMVNDVIRKNKRDS